MPAARKTPARKTPASARPAQPAPAEVAALEAHDDDDIRVEFRGEQFVISGKTRRSFHYAMAIASGNEPQIMYEMISPQDRARFIALGKPDEDYFTVAVEFFAALAEASGQGNS